MSHDESHSITRDDHRAVETHQSRSPYCRRPTAGSMPDRRNGRRADRSDRSNGRDADRRCGRDDDSSGSEPDDDERKRWKYWTIQLLKNK